MNDVLIICADAKVSELIAINAFERTYLEKLLKKHSGKIRSSAKEARITSRQFSRLANKHDLDKKTYKK